MNLMNSRNNNIEFSQEEAAAVLKGDFSLKVPDENEPNLPAVSKTKLSLWMRMAIGLVAFIAIVYMLKVVLKKKKTLSVNKNNNPKSISYAKSVIKL